MSYFAKVHGKKTSIVINIDIDKVIYAAENGFISGFKVLNREKFSNALMVKLLEIDCIEQHEEGETAFEGIFNAILTDMCESGVDYISYYPG
jgi:hypothetical protein